MKRLSGGMEFRQGTPIRLSAPPAQVPRTELHLEVAAKPEVQAGQAVKVGEVLARGPRRQAWRVSPAAGIVRQVTALAGTPAERHGEAQERNAERYGLMIEPAEAMMAGAAALPRPPLRDLDGFLEALYAAGCWADGDGGVGLLPQLELARKRPVDTLICVGVDPFPPCPVNSSLLLSFPDDAVLGAKLLAEVAGARRVKMVVGAGTAATARVRSRCRRFRVPCDLVPPSYPAVDPTLVIWRHASGRRRLPFGRNPAQAGVMLVSPWTAIRLARWINAERLDLVRPLLLAWLEGDRPLEHVWALPGQPLAALHPRLAGRGSDGRRRMLWGHPMNGRPVAPPADDSVRNQGDPTAALPPPAVPEDKLLLTMMPLDPAPPPQPCISCGWCVEVCPTRLRPAALYRLAQYADPRDRRLDPLDYCIECGLCSHVCPTALPLAPTFRQVHRIRAMQSEPAAAPALAGEG